MPFGISIRHKITNEELLKLHWQEELTLEEIGIHFGYTPTSARTVMTQIFNERNLPHRNRSEAVKLRIRKHPETVAHLKGPDHPGWKGGRHKRTDGYIVLHLPDHPLANHIGNVYEHRLVWEQTHKKKIPKGWHIHHLNGIKSDNRPENLVATSKKNHNKRALIEALQERIQELEQLHLL